MIKMNRKMKELLKQKRVMEKNSIHEICKKIISKTTCINDCILYDEYGNLEQKKINWNFVLRVSKDWTGYEVSHNEILIPDEIFNESLLDFELQIKTYLKNKFPNREFCVILSYSSRGILRFHTYRPQEGLWLSLELEKYDDPILYELC